MPTKQNKNYGAMLLTLLLLGPVLAAHADNEDVIARCAKIPSVGDRILCLEDALRSAGAHDDGTGDPETTESDVPPASPPTDVAEMGAVSTTVPQLVTENAVDESTRPAQDHSAAALTTTVAMAADADNSAQGAVAPAPIETQGIIDETPNDPGPGPTTEVAAATRSTTESEQFGLSERQRNPETLDSVNVVVVSVDSNAYGKLIFTTESGQVWRQTDMNKRRYRQIPFDAEIRRGASGSFFIRPVTGGASVRVKRSR